MRTMWESERLILRRCDATDAPSVVEYGLRSAEFHAPWDPIRPAGYWELSATARRLQIEYIMAEEDRGLVLYLSLRDEPGAVLGRIALNNIVRGAFHAATVGYGLAPDATGKGLMTEALDTVVEIAFDDLGLHRVEANVIPRNERSLAVVERCGFEREGVARSYLRIAGEWEDHVRFSRVNEHGEAPS